MVRRSAIFRSSVCRVFVERVQDRQLRRNKLKTFLWQVKEITMAGTWLPRNEYNVKSKGNIEFSHGNMSSNAVRGWGEGKIVWSQT